jgi:RNA polymerase sigma-70 factor (ECF subfamily)
VTPADPAVPGSGTEPMLDADLAFNPDSPFKPDSRFDPDSAAWVRGLTDLGADHDATVVRLHEMLLRVARHEARRRGAQLHIAGPELDDVAHQAAADAVVAVTGKVRQFRGDSRFTTWAYKFAVFEVSTKINRHAWRKPTVAMEAEDWDRLPDRFGFDPAEQSEWAELMDAVRRAVDDELTAHQRRVFVALVLNAVPLDAVVAEMGSNRNAIYKTLFDARRKLHAILADNGYLDHDTPGLP